MFEGYSADNVAEIVLPLLCSMSESFYKIVNIDITDNHIQSINSPTSDHLYGYIILWLDRKTGKIEITFLF